MKIGIVGSGLVGSTAAFALVMRGVGRRIVLVDQNRARAEAEADDVLHAVPFAHALDVRAGDYADLKDSQVVILAAGSSMEPGETRLQLTSRNARVFGEIVPEALRHAPDAVLLVATNPVDVMTHAAAHYAGQAGVPSSRVLGSGTTLDTARFRALLGRRLQIDARHIHAYVLGEHGDSEVLGWSGVSVAGMALGEFCRRYQCNLGEADRREIEDRVRRAAYNIIAGKGATYYGIGSALAYVSAAVIQGRRALLTVCTPRDEVAGVRDVTVSLPHLVSSEGIVSTIEPALDDAETAALARSARIIRNALDGLGL